MNALRLIIKMTRLETTVRIKPIRSPNPNSGDRFELFLTGMDDEAT